MKYLLHSFFLVLFSISAFAQEAVKPLSANINYLYHDLKLKPRAPQTTVNNVSSSRAAKNSSTPLFFDDFSYSTKQSYPLQSLWMDSLVYINSGFAIAPLSIGVATFDGLNKFGYPYTPAIGSDNTVSLPADILTSIPIDLSTYSPTDSVALSFYYQAKGNGEAPELADSLLLDFYKPKQQIWFSGDSVWYHPGNSSPSTNDTVFERAFIYVIDTAYLHPGFQFRFRNKATTGGDFDHWNIDYVYLDSYRHSISDTSYTDYAFGYVPSPFLKNYAAMPWRQYDTSDFVSHNSVFIRNNGIVNGNLTYTNNFYDTRTATQIYGYYGGHYPDLGLFKYAGWLNFPNISNPTYTYNLPALTSYSNFAIQHIISQTAPDFVQANDTVVQHMNFSNFFAFDDGSAEGGYYVNAFGAKIAGKYIMRQSDTLKSVRIYFDPAGSLNLATTENYFNLIVWAGGPTGPSNTIIYRDTLLLPTFPDSTGFDAFSDIPIKTLLVLSPGIYYIGVQQTPEGTDNLVIGFDKNVDHSSSLYYDAGGGWQQSQIYGSIMIRPVFGTDPPLGIKENYLSENNLFSVYPNPSSTHFIIQSNQAEKASYTIINSLGQTVGEDKITSQQQIVTTENLTSGIYFLILKVNDQLVQQQKIIIQH